MASNGFENLGRQGQQPITIVGQQQLPFKKSETPSDWARLVGGRNGRDEFHHAISRFGRHKSG